MSRKNIKESTGKKEAKPNFILLALAFALFVIGIHQSITVGFGFSYWIFMLSVCLLLLHRYQRGKNSNTSGKK